MIQFKTVTENGIVFIVNGAERIVAMNHESMQAFLTEFNQTTFQKGETIYNIKHIDKFIFQLQNTPQLTLTFFDWHIQSSIKNLGPRFNEKLNFKLPIVHKFHYLSKDEVFKAQLLAAIDSYLTKVSDRNFTVLQDTVATKLKMVKASVLEFANSIDWEIGAQIEIQPIIDGLDELWEVCSRKMSELYDLNYKEQLKYSETKYNPLRNNIYDGEIGYLGDLLANITTFKDKITNLDIKLSNQPFLFIKGEAGTGKSHLLGDIASNRTQNNLPTILLLGTDFNNNHIWDNIIQRLGLSCTSIQLLEQLNALGKEKKCRVLILIDALNEGAGGRLWYDQLAGFIQEISQYPNIGLVCTIRTTYLDKIASKQIQTDYRFMAHNGFSGNEYAALALFCAHYDLKQPNFPILAPEFSNPLFLVLTCTAIAETRHKEFPKGMQGLTTIFHNYLNAIAKQLERQREEYDNQPKLLRKALDAFSELADSDFMRVELGKADELFVQRFPRFPHLLNDLINNSVFIKNAYEEYLQKYDDYLIFAYQRLGDFIKAEQLLAPYTDKKELLSAFSKKGEFGDFFKINSGVLSIFALILPEKYGLELFEVYDWIYTLKRTNSECLYGLGYVVNDIILNSLRFRKIESIDNEKITTWLNNSLTDDNYSSYLNILISLSIIPKHPFNGDRLHRILTHYDMPNRDAFWQNFLQYALGKDDDGNAYPLQRLIDWAWLPNISKQIDYETTRLTAQTLTWVLATTFQKYRDQATKALVNLLQEQPDVLLETLKRFESIDDMYITERLYAVAYGCILRTNNTDGIKIIADYVYKTIFENGNPPVHLMTRCYARNIVQYAVYRGLESIDLTLICPPYNSLMPEKMPTKEDLDKYEWDNDENDAWEMKRKKRVRYWVKYSITDKAHKDRLNSILSNTSPINEKVVAAYKVFLKGLNTKNRGIVKLYQTFFLLLEKIKEKKGSIIYSSQQEQVKQHIDLFEALLEQHTNVIKKEFNTEEQDLFFNKYTAYFKAIYDSESSYNRYAFEQEPIRAWIIQRVFELGYNVDLHTNFDISFIERGYGRRYPEPERIGKKYENIAYYEILARIFDNHKVRSDWGNDKTTFFQGTWEHDIRDIDPTNITRETNNDDDEDDNDKSPILPNKEWWYNRPDYEFDGNKSQNWLNPLSDLPSLLEIIEVKDKNNDLWVYLDSYLEWKEAKPIGVDRYNSGCRNIWYQIRSYFVPKNKKQATIAFLEHKKVYNMSLPESGGNGHCVFTREHYFSQASKSVNNKKWHTLEDDHKITPYKVMNTVGVAKGEFSEDKSEVKKHYLMPSQTIFEKMNLQYASEDGCYCDKSGKIMAFAAHHNGDLLIRKKELIAFLEVNKLEIIWTVIGEKRIMGNNYPRNNLSGLYSIDAVTKNIVGDISGNISWNI